MVEQNRVLAATSAGSPALELFWGPASTLRPGLGLVTACEAGDWETASRINLELAREFPFNEPIRVWTLLQIGSVWDDDILAGRAREAWASALRQRREKLAGLGARLKRARPKIEEAKTKIAGINARLEAVKPKIEAPSLVPGVPATTQREKPKLMLALPGVAGAIQDYYLRTAMQPSEIISLAVGLMVPTVLVSGNVIGPSGPKGCALQQTLVVLAPTSSGKQWAIDLVKECLHKSGARKLLGPNRFKSGAALVRWVKDNRVSLCVQDEFGRLLAKLGNPRANPCEVEINERMREFWAMGPGSIYNSPVGAGKDDNSESIIDPRLNILGFGVQDEFFEACKGDDIANGFLNRIAVLEEAALVRPRSDYETGEFPWLLMEKLNKLQAIKSQRLDWTAGAKEIYEAEVDRVFRETDARKLKLWSRTPLKVVRAATTFAACRFATAIERSDMELAQAVMHLSDRAFKIGIDEAEKKRQLDHASLKLEIERRIEDDFDGEASLSEIKRSFRHNTKHKGAVDDALEDMVKSQTLETKWVDTGGRRKEVYRLREAE
jgi:hypothetical protein